MGTCKPLENNKAKAKPIVDSLKKHWLNVHLPISAQAFPLSNSSEKECENNWFPDPCQLLFQVNRCLCYQSG